MEPIKINVEEKFKHTHIAFTVDSEKFLEDICEIRKKWLGETETTPSLLFEAWFEAISEGQPKRDEYLIQNPILRKRHLLMRKKFRELGENEAMKFNEKLGQLLRKIPNFDFKGDIEDISLKYGIPRTCYKAVCRAIISGEINDGDWVFTAISLTPPQLELGEPKYGRNVKEPKCEIILTPYSTADAVSRLVSENLERIKELYKTSPFKYRVYPKRTTNFIKRNREWYWLQKNGMTIGDISIVEEEKLKHKASMFQIVKEAIRDYKKHLKNN